MFHMLHCSKCRWAVIEQFLCVLLNFQRRGSCAGANASTSQSLPVPSSKRGLPPAVPLPQPSLVGILHYHHLQQTLGTRS